MVGAELEFEAEIGGFEEDAGVEEAGAADGEFVEGAPAAGRGGAVGEEIGDDGGEILRALVFPAEIANERGESGAYAVQTGPVARIVVELEETWTSPESPRSVLLESAPIEISADRAVSLGVVVNELVTNACKYAYGPGVAGEVRVRLTGEDGGRFRLVVEDDGCGMAEGSAPTGTGVGSRVIAAMTQFVSATTPAKTVPKRPQ